MHWEIGDDPNAPADAFGSDPGRVPTVFDNNGSFLQAMFEFCSGPQPAPNDTDSEREYAYDRDRYWEAARKSFSPPPPNTNGSWWDMAEDWCAIYPPDQPTTRRAWKTSQDQAPDQHI